MSMQAINYALTLPVDESGPRLALILIAHHINWKSGDMFVGQDELAKEVRCSERTIRRYLEQLCEAGFVTREKRVEADGRRSTDRICLVGYLEWQEIIQNGGTLQDPKTRGKPIKHPPDKLAAGSPATGQTVLNPPDKNGPSTGQQVSGTKEPLLNLKSNHTSANNLVLEVKSAAAQPELRLVPSDGGKWDAWMAFLGPEQFDQAEASGVIFVTAYWPDSKGARLVRIGKAATLTDRSKAMQGAGE